MSSGPRSFPDSVLVAYPSIAKQAAFTVPANKQLAVYNVRAFNNSGGAIDVGICRKLITSQYQMWTLVGSTYTDVSSTINAGSAVTVFDSTNGDGFLIQTQRRSNLVGLTVSTAHAGGTFIYQYWTGAAFTTLTTLTVPADYTSTGDKYIVFRAPYDWVVGGPTDVNQLRYTIKVSASVNPGGNIAVNALWVADFLEYYVGVANNAAVELVFPNTKPFEMLGGEQLMPYFATANATNQFGCYYSLV